MSALHSDKKERDPCTMTIRALPFQDPILKDCIFKGQIISPEDTDVFESHRTTIWKPIVPWNLNNMWFSATFPILK